MHTIQIPGTRLDHKHPDDPVSHRCEVVIDFQEDGDFERTPGGDDFSPKMPEGCVYQSKSPYKCTSPNHDDKVQWTFTAKSDGFVTTGTIFVEKDAKCEDPPAS